MTCRTIASLFILVSLTGCNIAGGIGGQHIPDDNYNDGVNYTICLKLTAPGGNASKAFTEAYIVLDGVRARMTKTVDTKDKVEFVYVAKTADLVGKIPKYHFEYSGGKLDRFMNRGDRVEFAREKLARSIKDWMDNSTTPSRRSSITPEGYRIHTPTESVSKPVSAEPDIVYDSIEQIKFDPPIVRAEMGKAHTYKQFQATLYDKDNHVVGELIPYYVGSGGWYISYSDSSKPITVYKRRAK